MDSSEKFCLRWNDFEVNIISAFTNLKEEKDFTDVTLACSDNQVEAHKVILASSSPFFKRILKKNPHSHPLIYLKGIKFSDVEAVLKFIYQGEVNVEQCNLDTFLKVAEELEVKGLVPGKDHEGGSNMQSPFPRIPKQSSAVGSDMQSTVQTHGQLSSQTMQEVTTSVINNTSKAAHVKVEPGESLRKQKDLDSLDLQQDDGIQVSGEYGEGVEQDMHGYSTKITEGENRGKFQCILCGQISRKRSASLEHVEAIHFPGSYEHQCDQCDEKFDTKTKWRHHRTRVHSCKKSK